MSILLLKYFNEISEAPDAVPRLRRFILDLAVRGKLVEQDPNDEPAGALLERIAAVKAAGSSRRATTAPLDIVKGQVPWGLPESWKWVCLGNVSELVRGISFPASAKAGMPGPGRLPCFRSGNIQKSILWKDFIYIPRVHLTSDAQVVQPKDILISIANSYALVGKSAIVENVLEEATFGAFLAAVRLYLLSSAYVQYYLSSNFSAQAFRKGSAQTTNIANITFTTIRNHLIAVPPLAEQHRIAAKVDELMALCNELEAAATQRETRRDRLVASTLHGLNNGDAGSGSDARPSFKESARFYFNHLPQLTTRPEHIKQFRQTILNLAVRGKLVEQDPNDEPALELLAKIAAAKDLLIKQGKLKRQRVLEPVDEREIPTWLPHGWQLEKAGNLFLNVTDGFHNTPKPVKEGYKYITAKHIRAGKIDFENCLCVDEKNHRELFAKTRVKRGDILIVNIGAGCGIPAIINVDFEFSFKNVAVVNMPALLDHQYVFFFLLYYRNVVFEELVKGGAQPFLGLSMLREMVVPLPPLAEQHRIVAKVNELMAACDELETGIIANSSVNRKLLEVTLHEALSNEMN